MNSLLFAFSTSFFVWVLLNSFHMYFSSALELLKEILTTNVGTGFTLTLLYIFTYVLCIFVSTFYSLYGCTTPSANKVRKENIVLLTKKFIQVRVRMMVSIYCYWFFLSIFWLKYSHHLQKCHNN